MNATARAGASAASALIDSLIAGGVRHAVLSPGSRSAPLALALHQAERRGAIAVHPILDERSAAFFALGVARAGGGPPIVVATSGSAGGHWLPAVIEASESNLPLFLITADRPPELIGCGAPQSTDQLKLFGSHCRAFIDLGAPEPGLSERWLVTVAARARLSALGVRPGPVHLNAAFREPLWAPEVEGKRDDPPPARELSLFVGRLALDPDAQAALLDLLLGASRGLLVVGPGPIESAGAALIALAERLAWPVIADGASQLRFGPFSQGVIAHHESLLRSPELMQRLRPDRVLCFGRTPCSKPLAAWLSDLGRSGVPIAEVDRCGQIHDPEHAARVMIAADPTRLAEELAAAIPPRPPSPFVRAWRAADRAAAAALEPFFSAAPLWEGAIARRLVSALSPGTLLQVGNGMPIRDLDAFAGVTNRPIAVIAQRGANGIDGGLSSAAGAAAAWAGPIALLIGDLGFLHDLGGLRLLAGRPITVVVIDNGGGGIFEHLPIAAHPTAFGPLFLTPQPDDLEALARGFGVDYRRIDPAAAESEALEEAIAEQREGPLLLHLPIDRKGSIARRAEAEQAAAAAALRRLTTHSEDPS